MTIRDAIQRSVIGGDFVACMDQVKEALEQGTSWEEILNESLIAAMLEVGERYKRGEIFLPEMMISARAMLKAVEVLEPLITAGERKYLAKMVIGTVRGDLHNIGKNIVIMMCKGVGMELIDLGVDVPTGTFVEAIREHKPEFLGLSALLTSTMPAMEETIRAVNAAGMRNHVKVLVGGAPVTERFAEEIGADAYAHDAATAVDIIRAFSH